MALENIIIDKKYFKVQANKSIKFDLNAPFKINDSILSIIHSQEVGLIHIKLSNAQGYVIFSNFNIIPFVPMIIAFKEYITDAHKLLNDMDFSIAEITPTIDLEGEFSFSNNYPKTFVDLHRSPPTAKGKSSA